MQVIFERGFQAFSEHFDSSLKNCEKFLGPSQFTVSSRSELTELQNHSVYYFFCQLACQSLNRRELIHFMHAANHFVNAVCSDPESSCSLQKPCEAFCVTRKILAQAATSPLQKFPSHLVSALSGTFVVGLDWGPAGQTSAFLGDVW